MADLQPKLLELFRHPGPAVAAKTETMLFADMRQQHHIAALAPTGPIVVGAVADAMPAADVAVVTAWIDEGALDN